MFARYAAPHDLTIVIRGQAQIGDAERVAEWADRYRKLRVCTILSGGAKSGRFFPYSKPPESATTISSS
jgi:hypothetical protein